MSHFKLISSTKASDVIPINKYVSQKTGITVIIGDVEGPLVNGFFCLATEAHDDDGLPHTLEHLIFLGSERYPYKGILDLLANRCMAHGTNAWTDTDHTCYTVSTAGDAGMLTLLPIYLDHILWPTLTEQGFITEVHHISGDGEDAGVVYCEMQGRENTAQSRCELRLLRAMYPNSGYSAETGGIMENLRTSTNNAKVKNYHKKFYRPENLTIILTGQIEADDVFNALAIVEDDIIAKRVNDPREQWVKPWQTVPPPAHFGEMKEQWPADTEDCGQVSFGWRGPGLTGASALKELTSCAILLRYLCDTAAAPLQRCLVEREDALAGDVSYNLTENLVSVIRIDLDNVPIDKLEMARTEARNCLANVCSGVETIDMERIHRLLRKQLRETNASLESDPHHVVAFRAIGDAIYSQNEQDFFSRMNPQHDLRALMEETSDYWLALLQTYFNDDVITVIGSPSIEMQTRMAEEEKKRIEEQRVRLGQEGLAEKEAQLTEAIEFNERPPPDGTLSSVPIPSCASLKFHAVSTWSSDAAPCPHLPLDELPFYARVHSLKTNFVYISLIFETSTAAEASRRWTPLHTSALGEWAVRRGAALVPHEEVVSATERLTVLFNGEMGIGSSGNFSVGHYGNLLHIETRCEPEDYEAVVNHLYEVLYASEITKERLLVFAQRLINEVAQLRRNGSKMAHDTLLDAICSKDTNVHWCSLLRQQRFLKQLIEQLGAGGDSAEAALRDARDSFADITRNAWLHLATDFDRYTLSAEPWKKFQNACTCPGSQMTENQPKQLPKYSDLHLMSKWDGGGFVVGVGGLESSFVMQMSPGPLSNALDDVAPLYVALNYFTQLEGPMWRSIRGCGLSYGYGVSSAPREGRLEFSLYKATNTIAAYSKAKSIMEEYLADSKFDEDLFASAKSTALFEVVESKKSPADVVRQSLLNVIQGVGENYISSLVCGVSAVTGASAHAAAARWLPALLQPQRAKLAVVCHPSKVTDIQAAFHKLGIVLEAFESIEASHFNK